MNTSLAPLTLSSSREWLEADGLGGFASGTSAGIRTRRYHALLLPATTPPTGRVVLVNGFDAWVETANGTFSLSSQRYSPDMIGGDVRSVSKALGGSRGRIGFSNWTTAPGSSTSFSCPKARP